nr:methionine--trna ligase, chloroplastic/mitochondrial [Quercus suber]
MIFIVILIRKLREYDSSNGSNAREGGDVINSQVNLRRRTEARWSAVSTPPLFLPITGAKLDQKWLKRFFSVSRASVYRGIPVPNDNKQTIYVWLDALLGYVSALSEYTGQADLQSAVSSGWPASLHLIKKCISIFYAYWKVRQIRNDINISESEADKDHTLLELERQCLEV